MNNLFATLQINILNYFDPLSELRQSANDINSILTGYGDKWLVMDANGVILSTATSPVNAVVKAKFGVNGD
jgi:hypothetical protein